MFQKILNEVKFQAEYLFQNLGLGFALFWEYVKDLFKVAVSRILCKLGLCPKKDYDKLLQEYFEIAEEQEQLKQKLEELSL